MFRTVETEVARASDPHEHTLLPLYDAEPTIQLLHYYHNDIDYHARLPYSLRDVMEEFRRLPRWIMRALVEFAQAGSVPYSTERSLQSPRSYPSMQHRGWAQCLRFATKDVRVSCHYG
jgi:hypothetical protein